jgi:restriction system protein
MKKLPHRQELMKPILRAITDLGGSASVDEIRERVIQNLGIEDGLANIEHKSARAQADGRTELEYQLAWARTTLKELGFLENSNRGVWRLIRDARDFDILEKGNNQSSENKLKTETRESDWRGEIVKVLIEKLTPAAFERLIQLVLRETGFVQVDVTGRTGDGGIDGRGIAKINGILSFHVVFQCKRYKGAVPASQIRDFRGAMQGRADKGLFITTGYFTRDALKEAVRDGAVAIDLVDGEKLADKLKELRLGVKIENVEKISIDEAWLGKI